MPLPVGSEADSLAENEMQVAEMHRKPQQSHWTQKEKDNQAVAFLSFGQEKGHLSFFPQKTSSDVVGRG